MFENCSLPGADVLKPRRARIINAGGLFLTSPQSVPSVLPPIRNEEDHAPGESFSGEHGRIKTCFIKSVPRPGPCRKKKLKAEPQWFQLPSGTREHPPGQQVREHPA